MKKWGRSAAFLLLAIGGLGCSSDGETADSTVSSEPQEEEPSRSEVVATGTIGDTDRAWELEAELTSNDFCLTMRGTVCVGIPTDDVALQGMASSAGDEDGGPYSCTYGAISSRVTDVQVLYVDGSEQTAELFDGSGWGVNFFAVCRDENVPTSNIELSDEAGAALTFNG